MPIHYYQDEHNGYLVYENTYSGKEVFVMDDDLADAIEVCEQWHDGQKSACYRLMKNDFSYRNLRRTLSELRRMQKLIDDHHVDVDGDDYLDLLTTIEDLEGITRRLEQIQD